jgi:fatty acid desaturase
MTKEEYVELRKTLDFKLRYSWLIAHFLIDLALIALPAALLWSQGNELALDPRGLCVGLVSSLSLAVFYFRSFSMMHEAVHGTLSANRRINDFLGLAYGAVCFLPFGQWREIHLLHHFWAGNIEKDPVRKLVLVFRQPPNATRKFLSVMWRSWFPILALMQNYVFWFESVSRFGKKPSGMSFVGLVLPIAVWGLAFLLAGPLLSAAVLVPSILIYLAMVEVVNFPHHMDLPQYEGETKLALWEQYEIARSCFYPKFFSHFVLLNFNYHTEHHLYPTLPWYRLAELSARLRQQLPGYNFSAGNEWILRNRRKPLEVICASTSEFDDQEDAA